MFREVACTQKLKRIPNMQRHLHIGISNLLACTHEGGFNANTQPCRTFAQLWLPVNAGLCEASMATPGTRYCLRGSSSRLQQQLPMTGLRRAPAPGAPEYRQP